MTSGCLHASTLSTPSRRAKRCVPPPIPSPPPLFVLVRLWLVDSPTFPVLPCSRACLMSSPSPPPPRQHVQVDKSGEIIVFEQACPWKAHLFALEEEADESTRDDGGNSGGNSGDHEHSRVPNVGTSRAYICPVSPQTCMLFVSFDLLPHYITPYRMISPTPHVLLLPQPPRPLSRCAQRSTSSTPSSRTRTASGA